MFRTPKDDTKSDDKSRDVEITDVKKKLDEARKKVIAQKNSMETIEANIRNGGTGGIISPQMSQRILESYEKEAKELELRLQFLESAQKDRSSHLSVPK